MPAPNAPLDLDNLEDRQRLPIALRLARLKLARPRDIDRRLVELGYHGQDEARRAGAVLAYRHLRRLRRVFIDRVPAHRLPARPHALFVGASGCGKTYLVELLFREILKVPTVIEDATQFTEVGYVGRDVATMLSRLVEAAQGNLAWAACGVICVDEFDKLCAAVGGTNVQGRDVSGIGVQRGLLGLLSSPRGRFPDESRGMPGRHPLCEMPLDHVMFLLCGAFAGLARREAGRQDRPLGFTVAAPSAVRRPEGAFTPLGEELLQDGQALVRYGVMPELLGRLARIVPFQPLSATDLRQILEDVVLARWREEFAGEGLELAVEDRVLETLAEGALERQTGARGLYSAVAPALERAAYECFGGAPAQRVTLTLDGGRVLARCGGATLEPWDGEQAVA